MSVEGRLLQVLEDSPDVALVPARKSYGYAVQDDEKEPTFLPLLILRRTGSEWFTDICGTRALPCFVNVEVIHAARTSAEAREQARACFLALINSAEQPRLDSETDRFDEDLQAFTVVQQFTAEDHDPDPTRI